MSKRSDLTRNPSHFRSFVFTALAAADIDLTAQPGCPPYEAERLEVHNDGTATKDIVVRGPDGTNVTIEVPADSVRVVYAPLLAIESTGTEAAADGITSVTAFWWHDGSRKLNA